MTQTNAMKLHTPILGSLEHDSVALYITDNSPGLHDPTPAPPATAVVNSAIDLFTILLPLQQPKVQESILEQLVSFLASKSLDRDPGRKAAITVNVAVALLGALKLAANDQISSANLSAAPVQKTIQEILQVRSFSSFRAIAADEVRASYNIPTHSFAMSHMKHLGDSVVLQEMPLLGARSIP